MNNLRQITAIQTSAILASSIIGVGVLALPLFAVKAADSGAPLVTLLGMGLGYVGLFIITLLGVRFPNQSIIRYSEAIIGRWLAWIGSIAIIAFFAILTSLAAREFGEVVVTSVLKRTPVEVTVIVMLALATLSCRNGIRTFAYMHHFYFPLLLGPGFLIVALSMKNADWINLQPIWGNDPSGMLHGITTVASLFQGSFVMTLIIPAMRRPDRAILASFWGIVIAGGLYVSIVIAAVSVFGPEEIKHLLWPTLELAKATTLPANVLERLDAAFLAVWVMAVFTTLLTTYFLTIRMTTELFRLKDHKAFSSFFMPFVFILALIPKNVFQMYDIIELVGTIGLVITIGYPGLLLIVALIRKKRGNRPNEQAMEQSR
ncbi:endospore germination permease [Paenibacillus lycopersici]|uniref:Endospore germination permease n=1 Tax=Paenibacillus lycopersici TaxID=2704462 RepID=A0A6C0G1A5_9BACL|nr:endospore germination permease [Paenibacillus lycopersici]QHT60999.1 endospore germination permease [Paenibacillus lycopersici]